MGFFFSTIQLMGVGGIFLLFLNFAKNCAFKIQNVKNQKNQQHCLIMHCCEEWWIAFDVL
ncbi:MAG: hypothetical protein ACI8RD_014892 [Bacillariaceae sp.]|jgi:hypothetical protein